MKKQKLHIGLWVCLLVICFAFLGQPAKAATYRQIAYVNTTDKALILKFKEFCPKGYNWTVTKGAETKPILKGTTDGGEETASKMLKVELKSLYASKSAYTLTVTAKDKKAASISVKYYTDTVLSKVTVGKTSKESLRATATLKSDYGCYGEFLVFKGANSTSLIRSAKFGTPEVDGTTTKLYASIAPSKLANGAYKTYSIMAYDYEGETYFGPGIAKEYKYLKTVKQVKGVKLSTKGGEVKITWTAQPNASYYKVYKSTSKSSGYKCIASKNKTNTYTASSLAGKKTYYFKVEAISDAGTKTVSGGMSTPKGIYVPLVPAKVKGVKFGLDIDHDLILLWSKTNNATGFKVEYKESTEKSYKTLGTTSSRTMKLGKLDDNTSYDIRVVGYRKSNNKKVYGLYSKVLSIKPSTYVSKNRATLLANGVRTIQHIQRRKSIYTTKKYTAEQKKAFINKKGYYSNTGYLVWISHYTQQVTVFKGSKGKWKIIKTFICATGKAQSPSPIGAYKVGLKESGWYYTYTKELYITHYSGRNSFHTRPLYNDGSVCESTLGRPASHGCIRCYNKDAKYIYDNMPKGTKVLSF